MNWPALVGMITHKASRVYEDIWRLRGLVEFDYQKYVKKIKFNNESEVIVHKSKNEPNEFNNEKNRVNCLHFNFPLKFGMYIY